MTLMVGLGIGPALTPVEGVGADAYASGPAPSGFHWEYVTFNSDRVTFNGVPVVALVRN